MHDLIRIKGMENSNMYPPEPPPSYDEIDHNPTALGEFHLNTIPSDICSEPPGMYPIQQSSMCSAQPGSYPHQQSTTNATHYGAYTSHQQRVVQALPVLTEADQYAYNSVIITQPNIVPHHARFYPDSGGTIILACCVFWFCCFLLGLIAFIFAGKLVGNKYASISYIENP